MGIFGSKAAKPKSPSLKVSNDIPSVTGITEKDRAMLDLKNSRDRLKKYRIKMEGECERLTAQATKLLKEGKRDQALLIIKLRRTRMESASNADSQLLSVMELMDRVEWTSAQSQVLNAIAAGNKILHDFHDRMPIEAVEALMDETQEAIEVQNEISQLLGGSWSMEDDEDLLKELDSLTAPPSTSKVSEQKSLDLPAPPTHEIVVKEEEEEEEIKTLQEA